MLKFCNDDLVNKVLNFSISQRHIIRNEFDKMSSYYTQNNDEFINLIQELKYSIEDKDYYSGQIYDRADDALNNIDKHQFVFNELYLLNSLDKIFKQITLIPKEILRESKTAKIFFYNLSEKQTGGSHLVFSAIDVEWELFLNLYYTVAN